jgi:hypothetical protein
MASGLLQHADSLAQEVPYEESYWARATPGTSAVEGMTERDFAAEIQTDPFEAIRTLRAFVEFDLVAKVDATKWLFPLILSSTFALLPGIGLTQELHMSHGSARHLCRGGKGVQDDVL